MSEIALRAMTCSPRDLRMWRWVFCGLIVFLNFMLLAVLVQEYWWFRGVSEKDRPALSAFIVTVDQLQPGDEVMIYAGRGSQVVTKDIVVVNNKRNLIVYPENREEYRSIRAFDTRWEKIVFFNQVTEIRRGEQVLWRRNPPPFCISFRASGFL